MANAERDCSKLLRWDLGSRIHLAKPILGRQPGVPKNICYRISLFTITNGRQLHADGLPFPSHSFTFSGFSFSRMKTGSLVLDRARTISSVQLFASSSWKADCLRIAPEQWSLAAMR